MIFVFAPTLEWARASFAKPRGFGPPGRDWKLVRDVKDVVGYSPNDPHEVVDAGGAVSRRQLEALGYLRARGIAA